MLRTLRVMLISSMSAVSVVAFGPFDGLPELFGVSDKILHFGVFYLITTLFFLSFPNMRRTDLTISLLLVGAASEILQAAAGRDCELLDLLADAAGVLAVHAPSYLEVVRRTLREQAGNPAAGGGWSVAARRPEASLEPSTRRRRGDREANPASSTASKVSTRRYSPPLGASTQPDVGEAADPCGADLVSIPQMPSS